MSVPSRIGPEPVSNHTQCPLRKCNSEHRWASPTRRNERDVQSAGWSLLTGGALLMAGASVQINGSTLPFPADDTAVAATGVIAGISGAGCLALDAFTLSVTSQSACGPNAIGIQHNTSVSGDGPGGLSGRFQRDR